MRTSRDTWLTKPKGDAKIAEGIFGYLTARVRQRAYDIVVREFKQNGLKKAQLARRWGKDPAFVTRFLSRPGNWEVDTYTEALFAISGKVLDFQPQYPVSQPARISPRPPFKQVTTDDISRLFSQPRRFVMRERAADKEMAYAGA